MKLFSTKKGSSALALPNEVLIELIFSAAIIALFLYSGTRLIDEDSFYQSSLSKDLSLLTFFISSLPINAEEVYEQPDSPYIDRYTYLLDQHFSVVAIPEEKDDERVYLHPKPEQVTKVLDPQEIRDTSVLYFSFQEDILTISKEKQRLNQDFRPCKRNLSYLKEKQVSFYFFAADYSFTQLPIGKKNERPSKDDVGEKFIFSFLEPTSSSSIILYVPLSLYDGLGCFLHNELISYFSSRSQDDFIPTIYFIPTNYIPEYKDLSNIEDYVLVETSVSHQGAVETSLKKVLQNEEFI